ncbi:MAG: low molecular weight phosphatase family protein [Nanoarchaeota archaeon]|nr:low molecular weight phosphatase family protein [Nanoarchaeota archaeon]
MKILFVCKSNIGRSQIAEAFFNNLSKTHVAISAGINAKDYSGRTIKELSDKVPRCMLEKGIDISEKLSKQLTEELANQSNFVIWIAPEVKIPEFIDKNKLSLWDISDAGGKPYEHWCQARDEIEKLVKNLIKDIE